MLVYLNVQVTSFPENPTPHDYTGLHEIEKTPLTIPESVSIAV